MASSLPTNNRGERGVSPSDLAKLREEILLEVQRLAGFHRASDVEWNRRAAFGRFEYVDVTFNSTANGDTEVKHSLIVSNPEQIRVIPVEWKFSSTPVDPPYVWRNIASSRRPWGQGYVILRCNIASAQARLLLISEAD